MKNTFKLISLTLLLTLTGQILPANLIVEKAQEPKTNNPEQKEKTKPVQTKTDKNEILEKKETKKEKCARLRKEKKAAKHAKKLNLKKEKEEYKKNKPKRSLGKKIAIGVGIVTITIVGGFLLLLGNNIAMYGFIGTFC